MAQDELDPHINFLFNLICPAAASDYSAVTAVRVDLKENLKQHRPLVA